jgi:hypothetical protein
MIGKKINQLATELAPESTDLTIIGDPISGVSKKITLAQLGAIFSGAVSFYNDLASFPVTGDINVIYCAKDTQKLYLWSGSAYVEVFPSQALLNTYQLRSEKGVSNGYASLDSGGKVPISQLPSSIMEYKGTWNAATNTPTLANGTGDTGDVYICNVAGTVNFGAGPLTFAVGDYVIYSGTIWQRSSGAVGTVTSVAASITGNSVSISGSPIVTSGTLAFSFAGNATQYVRGDGQLATLPTNGGGGGASVSYYLNGSINQGTIGGVTYYEMNKTPIIGAGTDFTRNSNGYIASFLTDANDPALLNIPAGNFNFETYFQASSGGGSPTFYIELYKYDGTTFTLIASNSGSPKLINDGTNIEAYFSALAVPQTTLTLTDRLAIRIYVTTAGRTITLHTENGHLCQVITTFTTGLTALNGLTAQVQYLATGTSGTDFNIASASATHTFNLPTASATNRGALSSADFTTFNNKQNALTLTTTGSSGAATLVGATLNIPNYGSALTGYVPYTGATANVNLGDFDLSSRSAYLEGTASYQAGLLIKQRGLYNFVTGAYTQIVADSATDLNIVHNQANTTRRRYALSVAALQDGDSFQYAVPRASGTIALTSNLAAYLPLAGGTMTGAIIGTTSTFTNAGSGVGVEITNSSTGDGLKINHSSGRALNIASSGSGFGIIINNSTASTSAPFTIQKQGSNVITLSDNGAANFSGQLTLGSTITNGTNTYTLPSATGTLALTSAIPANPVGGTGTTNYLPKFTGTSTIGNSNLINDASGNLGLGVTPSAWNSAFVGLDFNLGAWIASQTNVNILHLGSNGYVNSAGNWVYKNSTFASRYEQYESVHKWFTAPSGTAGNAISFTQAMTLDASGRLGIGTTSPNGGLSVVAPSSATAISIWGRSADNFGALRFQSNTGATTYSTIYSDASSFIFENGGSERMRITSAGNVGIGTTNPLGKLTVSNGGAEGFEFAPNVTSANNRILSYNRTTNVYNGLTLDGETLFFNTTGGERMRITSGGNLLVGTTTENTSIKFRVIATNQWTSEFENSYTSGQQLFSLFSYNGTGLGSIQGNGSNVSYYTSSDYRLKDDLKQFNALDKILSLNVYDFKWKSTGQRMDGFIAHELQSILPYAVSGVKDGEQMQNVDYSKLTPVNTKAIQELHAIVIEQQKQIEQLKNK